MNLRVTTTPSGHHLREKAKDSVAPAELTMKSTAAVTVSLLAASSMCPGPASSSVRLRPDATYVQLGDVDVPGARCVRIVHISDIPQGKREDLYQLIPDGDVLVHSGGLGSTNGGLSGVGDAAVGSCASFGSINSLLAQVLEQRHLRRLRDFLTRLPHRHKVLVPSSRDSRLHRFACSRTAQELQRKLGPCHYLNDSSVTLEGVTFYGIPGHSPTTTVTERAKDPSGVCRFNDNASDAASSSWQMVPDQVDVLVAPNPPWEQLAHELFERIRPKALLHGHGSTSEYGTQWRDGILLSNGSLAKVHKPVVIDFYTSRPGDNSQEYSEVMEVTSRLKRSGSEPACVLM